MKILKGTFRNSRDGNKPAVCAPALPALQSAPPCPKWLHRYARAEWGATCKALLASCVLTHADLGVLAAYCQAWAEFRLATETLDREGRITETQMGGLKPHPAVNQQRTAWQAVRQFAALLGLDPSSRSRLATPQPVEPKDELQEFLDGNIEGA